jgi:hypothetical protein
MRATRKARGNCENFEESQTMRKVRLSDSEDYEESQTKMRKRDYEGSQTERLRKVRL